MKKLLLNFVLTATLLLTASRSYADPGVRLEGAVAHPTSWSANQLRSTFSSKVQSVFFNYRGASHQAACVPLWSLVEAAHPQFRDKVHNDSMTWVATVEGSDGYRVSFTLGELNPDFGNSAVWVALDQDGGPIPASDGPVRLILPNDVKLGRWVHSISRIVVAPVPSTSPVGH
jgi:hypothetical protein